MKWCWPAALTAGLWPLSTLKKKNERDLANVFVSEVDGQKVLVG